MSKTELLLALVIYFELHGRIVSEKEYIQDDLKPVHIKILYKHFGGPWKRLISIVSNRFPDRIKAILETKYEDPKPSNLQAPVLSLVDTLKLIVSRKQEVVNDSK